MNVKSVSLEKRDFGSFHSSNVQELLSFDEKEYIPPNIPIDLPSFDELKAWKADSISYGKKAKRDLFYLEEGCCFLNAGAFGTVFKPALEACQQWQVYAERQPLRFFDRELMPLLVLVSRKLAKFVGCSPKDIVLVSNATFGTNSVLKSLSLGSRDVILTFNITYGAVKKLVKHVCETTGATNKEITVIFPVNSYEEILNSLKLELSKGPVKLVIIDHIPSNAPLIMPVKEMVQICRNNNTRVLIDGAHALGSLPINIRDIDPDYYVSNAHKWLGSPKGAAFLYVKHDLQTEVRPAVISHGFDSGFNSEFVWTGLHDYSPMLSLITTLELWDALGVDNIQTYMYSTAKKAADLLIKAWSSSLPAPKEFFGSMILVELPTAVQKMFPTADYSAAESIQNQLYHQYNIEVPVKMIQEKLYVRLSAHIHNEFSDYEKLAKAINMIIEAKGNKLL